MPYEIKCKIFVYTSHLGDVIRIYGGFSKLSDYCNIFSVPLSWSLELVQCYAFRTTPDQDGLVWVHFVVQCARERVTWLAPIQLHICQTLAGVGTVRNLSKDSSS